MSVRSNLYWAYVSRSMRHLTKAFYFLIADEDNDEIYEIPPTLEWRIQMPFMNAIHNSNYWSFYSQSQVSWNVCEETNYDWVKSSKGITDVPCIFNLYILFSRTLFDDFLSLISGKLKTFKFDRKNT